MPTVSWILETAIDKYWERQPLPVIRKGSRARRIYSCPLCASIFDSSDALRSHLSLDHPRKRPVLLLSGSEISDDSDIYSPIGIADIELFNVSSCSIQIDGSRPRSIGTEDLPKRLAGATSGTWAIQLSNEREEYGASISKKYRVRFLIAQPADLDAVDELFIQVLAVDRLSHSILERFASRLPSDPASQVYGRALGDYALAVLMKDSITNTDRSVFSNDFDAKMRQALDKVSQFKGAVPDAVTACIRFNLNDFRGAEARTKTEIDAAMSIYSSRAAWRDPTVGGETAPTISTPGVPHRLCPIDQRTGDLLFACQQIGHTGGLSRQQLGHLEEIASYRTPSSAHDALKARILCVEGYLSRGERSKAKKYLRDLQLDSVFGNWAQRRLKEIDTRGT